MNQKTILRIAIILGLVAVIAIASLAYAYLKPTAEASAPIAAAPIATLTHTPAQPTAASTVAKPVEQEPTPEQPEAKPAEAQQGSGMLFEIAPERSQARFIINEVLNGAPKTVVGATNQVAGQIQIDAQTPANTRVGVIEVNARTLTTDNEFRNRAVKNRILMTNDFEFVTFTPTAITGLPSSVALNQPFQFQISGDLTVKGVTQSVTFDAEVTPISETELKGLASAVIKYADFGISIPNVPSVTGVDEDVKLEIEFVAVKK